MSLITPILTLLPFLVILVGMVGLKWNAAKAGLTAVAITIPIIIGGLGVDIIEFSAHIAPGSLLEAAFMSISILWIIFGALCIYHSQAKQGFTFVVQQALQRLHPNPRVSALFLAWFFSLFMEGAAGFGTSAALTAPFLVAAGYRPVFAVVLALWGHSIGVVFGAVGTPLITQAMLVSMPELALSQATIPFMVLPTLSLCVILSIGAFSFDRPAFADSETYISLRRSSILGLFAGITFLIPASFIAFFSGPELPTLLGSVIAAGIFTTALRKYDFSSLPASKQLAPIQFRELCYALAPYLILILLVLITRLIPEAKLFAEQFTIGFDWNGYQGKVQILYHPGSLLVVSFVAGSFIQRIPAIAILAAIRETLLKLRTVFAALFIMLFLSRILLHGGAIHVLSLSAVQLAGGSWPFWVAWFGALGTFISGSATASNILLSEFQRGAALSANYPVAPLLGAQSVGAAIGNMVCPHNIIAAGATVQLRGQEGVVMRYTLPVALLLCCLVGVSALLWIYLV